MIGSNRTTNEENYLLSKFARVVLKTNNVDHHRTADYPALAAALHGNPGKTASMRDVLKAPAILLIGNDPTNQHPLLAWQIRTNVRLRRARLYVINSAPIKLRRQAAGIWTGAGGRGSEGSRISCWRRFPARFACRIPGRRRHERAKPGLRCARKFAPNRTWSSPSVLNCAAMTSKNW